MALATNLALEALATSLSDDLGVPIPKIWSRIHSTMQVKVTMPPPVKERLERQMWDLLDRLMECPAVHRESRPAPDPYA